MIVYLFFKNKQFKSQLTFQFEYLYTLFSVLQAVWLPMFYRNFAWLMLLQSRKKSPQLSTDKQYFNRSTFLTKRIGNRGVFYSTTHVHLFDGKTQPLHVIHLNVFFNYFLQGQNALHMTWSVPIAEYLISKGANVNKRDRMVSDLTHAKSDLVET